MPSGRSSVSRSPSHSSRYQAQKTKLIFGEKEEDRLSTTTTAAPVSHEHTGTSASSCLPSAVSTDMVSQQPPSAPFREPLSTHQAKTWKAAANPAWQLTPVRCSTGFHFQSSGRNTKAQSHPSQTPSHFTLSCTVEVDNQTSSQTSLQPSAATYAARGASLPLTLSSTHRTFPTKEMAGTQGVMKDLSPSAS